MRINGTIKYLRITFTDPVQLIFGDIQETDLDNDDVSLAFQNVNNDLIYIQDIAKNILNVNDNNEVFILSDDNLSDNYTINQTYDFYIDVPDDLFGEEDQDEEDQDEEEQEEEEQEEEEVTSDYQKRNQYPSYKKPGVYPPGSIKELGLNNDDLEKFSLGNWNSISKSNRRFYVTFEGQPTFIEDLYEDGEYLGRPVRVRFVDNGPVLTWTLVRRVGGFNNFGQEIGGGYNSDIIEEDYGIGGDRESTNHIPEQAYYSNSSTWHDRQAGVNNTVQVGPLMPLSRFVTDYETNDVKKMNLFYRTFHNTYKRSDVEEFVETDVNETTSRDSDHYVSLEVRETIEEIFQEKYNQLKDIIDNSVGYIKELNPDDYDGVGDFEVPIQLTFKSDVLSQIDEILSFNIEVFGDGTLGQGSIGSTLTRYANMQGNWYHRFKLYFGAYNYNTQLPTVLGYSTFDDKGRDVGTPQNIGGVFNVNETYLPKDSLVLDNEPPLEFLSGIYLEKLTDDNSIVKIGDSGEFGVSNPKTGFTNTGRIGNYLERFYFEFSISNDLLNFFNNFSGTSLGIPQGQTGRDVLEERLTSIAHPYYIFEYIEDINYGGEEQTEIIDVLDFKISSTTENSNVDFLYYDIGDNYIDTSYPVKMKLNMDLLDYPLNENPTVLGDYSVLDQFYLGGFNPLEVGDTLPENGVYRYTVIQWGDEKSLLTDDMILNSEYFTLYTSEEVPSPDNFYYKRIINNRNKQLNFTTDSFHIYNAPGVKNLKIIVYRYDSTGNVLIQTTLVTKNIVINDGNLLSQDFSIFGGTDFNFLPIRDNQAIIGGFDEDSKFNNSVSKIVKDDNFVKEDYLERVSSKDYIQKFNSGLLGETPGQLDLSQTRVFKESKDIYDFIGGDRLEWINKGSGSLPLNSLATDIFIRDEKCVVDLNPVNSEFTTIQNQMGTKELGILIGDYKVNQPKDSRVQKQGVMQTSLLETDNDKQAF